MEYITYLIKKDNIEKDELIEFFSGLKEPVDKVSHYIVDFIGLKSTGVSKATHTFKHWEALGDNDENISQVIEITLFNKREAVEEVWLIISIDVKNNPGNNQIIEQTQDILFRQPAGRRY